jgi:sorbitol-specific phosphotransferase system component IIBC
VLVAGRMTASNAPCGLFSPRAAILLVPGGLPRVSPTNGRSAKSKKTGPAALVSRMLQGPCRVILSLVLSPAPA